MIKVYTTCILLLVLVAPAFGVKTNLGSAFSKGTTATETLPLDTTIAMAALTEAWLAVVTLRANNTSSQIVTINVTLKESLTAVPNIVTQLSLKPGTTTVQIPNQYFSSDFALGSHTFQVRVNQDTNSPVIYQVESSLELVNNTGYGGVPLGGGDVDGPGASIDNRIAIFEGTDGDEIADNGFWLIDPATGYMTTATGRLGVRDVTPEAIVDIENATPSAIDAMQVACSGAVTAGTGCVVMSNAATSATASLFKTTQVITASGSFNGAGSQVIGTYYDVRGGPSNQAVYIQEGDIVFVVGKLANAGDVTPDAHIDFESSGTDPFALMQLNANGTSAGTYTSALISSNKTGGASGAFKSGLQVNSGGAWAGINAAVMANASGGAEANAAFLAVTGDLMGLEGKINTSSSTSRAADFTCSAAAANDCLRVTRTALDAGTDAVKISATGSSPTGIDLEVTGGGAGTTAKGMELSVANANGNATGFMVDVVAENGVVLDFQVDVEADSIGATGMRIDVDGGGGAATHVGLDINVHNTTDAEAIRTSGGGTYLGAGGLEGFAYSDLTKHVLINGGTVPVTAAGLEVKNTVDEIGIAARCTATGSGDDCVDIGYTGDGTGTVGGLGIIANGGGGTSTAIAATLTATNALTKIALNIIEGDVAIGAIGFGEELRFKQADAQWIFNKDNGVAQDPANNVIEIHSTPGRNGLQVFAANTAADVGAAVAVTSTGAVTASSFGAVFSNGQTSSTNAINKRGVQVNSTGNWSGTGAINAAVEASATGGTFNYAFDALQGGMRTPWTLLKPQGAAPFTCTTDIEGTQAYAATSNLVCVCSDSDGADFEWEAIEDRSVTCSF